MKIEIDAPEGLQVLFICYVAYDDQYRLFAAQRSASEDEIRGKQVIRLKRGADDNG